MISTGFNLEPFIRLTEKTITLYVLDSLLLVKSITLYAFKFIFLHGKNKKINAFK